MFSMDQQQRDSNGVMLSGKPCDKTVPRKQA